MSDAELGFIIGEEVGSIVSDTCLMRMDVIRFDQIQSWSQCGLKTWFRYWCHCGLKTRFRR